MRDKALPSRGNLGAEFSERSFPHSKTYFTQIGRRLFLDNNLKRFVSNNLTLSTMFSFQNAWPIKRKAVYTLVLFHIYLLIFVVRIGSDHNFLFLKFTFLNFSKPS